MDINIQDLAGLGGLPVVIGVVQVVKNTFSTAPAYVAVATALVTSEVISEGVALAVHGDGVVAAITGIVLWLASMGLWSGTKSTVNSLRGV